MKSRPSNSAGESRKRGEVSPFQATSFASCAQCRIAARCSLKCTLVKVRRMKARFNWSAWIPSAVRSRQRATGPSHDRRRSRPSQAHLRSFARNAYAEPACAVGQTATETSLYYDDRCSVTANPGNMIFGKDARAVIVRYGERREHCPVADFKFLINVMQVHLDSAAGNVQPAPNFLVRQSFGHQRHDLRSRSVSTVSTFSAIAMFLCSRSRGTS